MCLYPRLITNPKYKSNKKNGGVIPPIFDKRVMMVPIGCQNCIECRKKKAREWGVRMQEEIRHNPKGKFVTLTFSNEKYRELSQHERAQGKSGYELDNTIATIAVRYWLERWRKKYKKSLKHWLCTELGHNGTENIHMHGIVWTEETLEEVEKHWQYGFIWKGKKSANGLVNYVTERTVNYIIKYITKIDEKHPSYKSIVLTSAGIGKNYIDNKTGDWKKNIYNEEGNTKETYITRGGQKIGLPIYYRNKLYTDEEKEKLWIEKLDKEERWIMGNKIDVSTFEGEYEYARALKYAQQKNIELGYGTDKTNWKQEEYEYQRRILKQQQRLCTPKGGNGGMGEG